VVNVISALSMHSVNFGRSMFQSFGGVFPTGSSIDLGVGSGVTARIIIAWCAVTIVAMSRVSMWCVPLWLARA
jgi:hypothetical protein